MQTLRKKTSPFKYKHETSRFHGEGQCFKAKLIGILEVSEARGDRMCQEALSDLKMAIRAAGEHKQRITVHIALDGLRLRDEKTGDCLYHHPVHKISFIAQDMTDSRAFGYIFGSPDTGHRFFGIKTDKAASQVVIAMRDLFQVVFALKKKEIELAKQHLEKNCLYNTSLFSDSSSNKSVTPELPVKYEAIKSETKSSSSDKSGTTVANLVDLQLELNSLQQGLNQMEKITPSEPIFGSKDDPFGDSFTSFPMMNPILPPPPSSGRERSRGPSESSSVFSPKTPHTADSSTTSGGGTLESSSYPFTNLSKTEFKLSRDFSSSHDEPSSGEWFTPSNSLFDETSMASSETSQKTTTATKEDKLEQTKREILSQFDVFTELDPLGTGRSKPYIDKKHFFQELKNPPKKPLKELTTITTTTTTFIKTDISLQNAANSKSFESDPFGEDPFVSIDPFADENETQDLFERGFIRASTSPKTVKFEENSSSSAPEPPPRPETTTFLIKPPPLPPKKQLDLNVKPPPRPPHLDNNEIIYDCLGKNSTTLNLRSLENLNIQALNVDEELPPALPVPQRKTKFETTTISAPPERPIKAYTIGSNTFEDDYLTPIQFTRETMNTSSNSSNFDRFENSLDGLDITLSQLTLSGLNELAVKLNIPSAQLSNMTLVQLTEYLGSVIKSKKKAIEDEKKKVEFVREKREVCNDANVETCTSFKADFESNFSKNTSETYDRYAVFRELIDEEIKQTKIPLEVEEAEIEISIGIGGAMIGIGSGTGGATVEPVTSTVPIETNSVNEELSNEDKYAALREIDLLKEVEKNNQLNKIDENEEKNSFGAIEFENKSVNLKSPSPVLNIKKIVQVPSAIPTEIQIPINSGSLSDLVSNSSPELTSELNEEKHNEIASSATAETWAVFDTAEPKTAVAISEKNVQSEEGLSPWSSDSKDGNGTPSDYRESGGDRWVNSRKTAAVKHQHHHRQPPQNRQEEDDWWDPTLEPEGNYNNSANRRSTDSYEDEYYECYDRPRRRKLQQQQAQASREVEKQVGNWGGGGHSSSSRDVSPWEEEPKRRSGGGGGWSRSRHRRPTDSWDDDDDYDYEDSRRFHWSRDSDRHSVNDNERWNEECRRRRRTRDNNDHRCCTDDWDEEYDNLHNMGPRYGSSGRWSSGGTPPGVPGNKWRDRKYDERYFSREESSWDDEFNAGNESHYVSSTKRANWKRPNSASEMERKSEKLRHIGGSDGERDRRYKGNRRSRSRDSQYSEPPSYRHKETSSLTRNYKKNYNMKPPSSGNVGVGVGAGGATSTFETDFAAPSIPHTAEHLEKKSSFATLQNRKKKELIKSDENTNTFPRKNSKLKQNFENNFQQIQPESRGLKYELDSSVNSAKGNNFKSRSSSYQNRSKSMFEDDFSMEKIEMNPLSNQEISVIKEEETAEENDSFNTNSNSSNRINTKRFSGCLRTDLKKSESVNIFVRENDPFDDDFFCCESAQLENDEENNAGNGTGCGAGIGLKRNNSSSSDRKLRNGDKWTDN